MFTAATMSCCRGFYRRHLERELLTRTFIHGSHVSHLPARPFPDPAFPALVRGALSRESAVMVVSTRHLPLLKDKSSTWSQVQAWRWSNGSTTAGGVVGCFCVAILCLDRRWKFWYRLQMCFCATDTSFGRLHDVRSRCIGGFNNGSVLLAPLSNLDNCTWL